MGACTKEIEKNSFFYVRSGNVIENKGWRKTAMADCDSQKQKSKMENRKSPITNRQSSIKNRQFPWRLTPDIWHLAQECAT